MIDGLLRIVLHWVESHERVVQVGVSMLTTSFLVCMLYLLCGCTYSKISYEYFDSIDTAKRFHERATDRKCSITDTLQTSKEIRLLCRPRWFWEEME